jgi:hypothetical protein
MHMLSLKHIEGSWHPHSGGYCHLMDGDKQVCIVEEWAFTSCGVGSLMNFGYSNWWTKENVDRLIELLVKKPCHGIHLAKEFYFCLSSAQVSGGCGDMNGLLKHPNVKFLDRYVNKAHGPCDMLLYRLSTQKDFDKCPSTK